MNSNRATVALLVLLFCLAPAWSQTYEKSTESDPVANSVRSEELPEPRAKNGKKLLTATDLMKVNGVSGPRISPDGARVAYLVTETRMEKDKEWKAVGQVWVTSLSGGDDRQFTRGERVLPRLSGRPTVS